jgi:hypothetical protein
MVGLRCMFGIGVIDAAARGWDSDRNVASRLL